jgi:LysR family nitrogen assimilation transcriptional regulator
MVLAKSKGPPRAVSAVAARIVQIVDEMAGAGMWRPGASADLGLTPAA